MSHPKLAPTMQAIPPGTLSISVHLDGDRHVIEPTGELDIASAPVLEATVADLCASGAKTVVIDLSGLTFIDSTGLRAILTAQRICDSQSCGFSLVPGAKSIQRLFVLTGLLEHLPFQANGTRHAI
jgi:anti-sigma B factor antagonist